MEKVRKDKFFAVRGSKYKILSIGCATCGTEVFTYQKDGIGGLHRCYANRVLGPDSLVEALSISNTISCTKCGTVLANAHIHSDGRKAFNLIIGTYTKKVVK